MARINIEEKWWVDPRRQSLADMVGDSYRADGIFLRLIKLAQENIKHGANVPERIFKQIPHWQAILDCDLAVLKEDGVYISGTNEHLSWLQKRSEAGKSSAAKRWQTHNNGITTASSRSTSSSSSSKKKNTLSHPSDVTQVSGWDFEKIYQAYPKRPGNMGKAGGMKKLQKLIKSEQDFDEALIAVQRYKQHCVKNKKINTEYVKMFSSFWDSLGDWKEWSQQQAVPQVQELSIEEMRKQGAGV